jgi:hypothetical protein
MVSIFDSRIEARLIRVRKDYLWLRCNQRKTTVSLWVKWIIERYGKDNVGDDHRHSMTTSGWNLYVAQRARIGDAGRASSLGRHRQTL